LVYSHDTFGLGNIRRMLAICEYLHQSMEDVSILILTGSPMLHSFRVAKGIDYIKLPCLKRSEAGDLGVRFLDLQSDEVIGLRKQLILSSVRSFRPDVVLVDKKPAGLAGELEPALRYVKAHMPACKVVLVLRDILDETAPTTEQWRKSRSDEAVEWFYDSVLVLGSAQIFDVRQEYLFSRGVQAKVVHCGYVKRQPGRRPRNVVRTELGVVRDDRLVLVTAGGGEDGCSMMEAYVRGLEFIPPQEKVKTLIVTGPEMPPARSALLMRQLAGRNDVTLLEFTDDLMSYMDAADLVISMAGYNTVCELLTLRKRAILVPRVEPVAEQRIRAERMSALGLFETVLPSELGPAVLMERVLRQLREGANRAVREFVDMEALPRIGNLIQQMCRPTLHAAMAQEYRIGA
jgi:predicted glycosyltransferase